MEGDAANGAKAFDGARKGARRNLIARLLDRNSAAYFLRMPIFNRGVLETGPSDADLFAARSGVTE